MNWKEKFKEEKINRSKFARYCGVHLRTVERWLHENKLPFYAAKLYYQYQKEN